MSRLAKKPIIIPAKTTVTFLNNVVTVNGPLGTLSRAFPKVVVVTIEGSEILVTLNSVAREHKALLGTAVSHIRNMVAGVNKAYEKKLIIEGVGYKADAKATISTAYYNPFL